MADIFGNNERALIRRKETSLFVERTVVQNLVIESNSLGKPVELV
jgi:hypothetical protein